jgi:uncharacterized protein (DUF1684 family)
VAAEATSNAAGYLELADWRRRVAELYAEIRNGSDPLRSWDRWREVREHLFLTHSQSPSLPDERDAAHAPRYFPYDPAMRVLAEVEEMAAQPVVLPISAPGEINAGKIGVANFSVDGHSRALAIYWLQEYSGGLFVSFRDSTSGTETYGAGRYVLDTAKGADLGMSDGRLILDFNFSYPPSCSYDPKWSCPLPPRENWLDIPIQAGERSSSVTST